MTVAERTREAVRAHPFLYHALRAGIVNYTAAARFLDVRAAAGGGADRNGDEAVAVALRRYAQALPGYERHARGVRVEMRSGLDTVDAPDESPDTTLLSVGDVALAPDDGSLTGIIARGEVGPESLADALDRLRVEDISVEAAAAGNGHLVVVVGRRDGPAALRLVEDTF